MVMVYYSTFTVIAFAFFLIGRNFIDLKNHNEGTDLMVERAAIIRSGAQTFLRREDRAILVVVGCVAIGYTLLIESWSGVALLFGAILSRMAVGIGMSGGTYGNVRTTNAARVTGAISRTIRIALLGGSLSGFTVQAFGLVGFTLVFMLSGGARADIMGTGLIWHTARNAVTIRLTAYSLGCSLVAMFNRVAGGTYTKSADIAADTVGKKNHGLDEDDPRNVCSIADLIGDCVNDIAGNVSDLLESFVATPLSCILIAMQAFDADPRLLLATCMYPFVLATGGLLSTILAVMYVILKNRKRYKWVEMTSEEFLQKYPDVDKRPKTRGTNDGGLEVWVEYSIEIEDPGAELDRTTTLAAIFTMVIGVYGASRIFGGLGPIEGFKVGWISPWLAALLGIISSVAIGKLTEYYTSTKYKPVQNLARSAEEGEAFLISKGIATAFKSVLLPVLVIAVSMLLSNALCGGYGIAIAAVGMLSFVGTTVSIDAFGPIADNAGGIAEGCGLDEGVRRITDELDAVGNTTAAIGKGNAIGSAAFASSALIVSYLGSYPSPEKITLGLVVTILAGAVIGCAIEIYFCGVLTDNTNKAAEKLAAEAERQLAIPGVMEGTVMPNYNEAIELAADNALRYMIVPSLLSIASPILIGLPFGPDIIIGMLGGAVGTAIVMAIYNANVGGAWDNAKKLIEMGWLNLQHGLAENATGEQSYGKGSRAHRVAIVGDTVGDITKDVVAVCLDISVKSMSTVSNSLAMTFYASPLRLV
ncbi:sodium/proton-translocating pyrophosphatase [Candidatus Saccharibacteria bacterium]|nr:sodium/proton-translocating pyrophosphatase [Candidatus Saccharibacteria bacterium]